jgi:hypothetical protein
MKQHISAVMLLLAFSLIFAHRAQAMAQITMVNRSQLTLNLYISDNGPDFYFGCGPVLGLGHFTNSPGQFCTSSITPGSHWLEARDGEKVVMHEDNINIGDGTSPTWTVTITDPDEELIKNLDGAKFILQESYPSIAFESEVDIVGRTLILKTRVTWAAPNVDLDSLHSYAQVEYGRAEIVGREAHITTPTSSGHTNNSTFTISEDGSSITERREHWSGPVGIYTYHRK